MNSPETFTNSTVEDEPVPESTRRRVDWTKPRVAAILAAAAKCFARSGFETTTAEIAKELSVPKSIIYHYFDNKDALIQEVQRYAYKQHLDRIRAVLAEASSATSRTADFLRALWSEKSTRNVAFDIGVWSALRNDQVVRRQAVELQHEHRRIIAENVARALGIEGADPQRTEPLTTLIMAATTGLALNEFIEGEDGHSDEAHALLVSLIERGLEEFKRHDSEIPPAGDLLSEPPPVFDGDGRRPPASC